MNLDVNDIVGKTFGRLKVISFDHKKPIILKNGVKNGYKYYYKCKCICGNYTITLRNNLLDKTTCSCGCYRKEQAHKATFVKNNIRKTRLYSIFTKMKARCYNENHEYYKNYGGRRIMICDEWKNDFKTFYDWSMANGYKDNLTIDRIDNNGNYEPSNCRWTDMKTQARNRRKNHLITYKGETHCISVWSQLTGIKQSTIRRRLKVGWSISKALNP